MKKFISTLLCITTTLSLSISASAYEKPNNTSLNATLEVELNYDSAVKNIDGTVTYDILNLNELAAAWGMNINEIKSAKYVEFDRVEESITAPRASISIENIWGPGGSCGIKKIAENSAVNNSNKTITKNITLTGTVSNTYSLSVESGIDVEVASISSAVGFDVTAEWSMSDSTEVELAPGESVTVTAMPLYDVYTYSVYKNSFWTGKQKVGTGEARETIGFCVITR